MELVSWVAVAAGGEHTLLVDANRRLFSCGLSDNGRLGIAAATDSREQLSLAQVDTEGLVVQHVAAGEYHSVFSTPDGRVFAFGSGSVGQLGLNSNADQPTPREILFFRAVGQPVRALAAGETDTFVVLQDGSVHAFGLDESGCLGLASTLTRSGTSTKHTERYGFGARGVRSRSIPQHVEALSRYVVVHVAAGSAHTLFLTDDGEVFGCGSNAEGQLGMGDEVKRSSVPRKVPMPDGGGCGCTRAASIACGSHHSVVLLDDGRVVVFGANTEGAMGVGRGIARLSAPTVVEGLPPISRVACGAAHTVLVTASHHEVLAAGWGKSGRLGLGTDYCASKEEFSNAWLFTAVPGGPTDIPIEDVRCGTHTTHLLLADGSVLSCGCGGRGQLGNGVAADAPSFVRVARHVHAPHRVAAATRAKAVATAPSDPTPDAEQLREQLRAQLQPAPSPVDPRHHELNEYARRMAAALDASASPASAPLSSVTSPTIGCNGSAAEHANPLNDSLSGAAFAGAAAELGLHHWGNVSGIHELPPSRATGQCSGLASKEAGAAAAAAAALAATPSRSVSRTSSPSHACCDSPIVDGIVSTTEAAAAAPLGAVPPLPVLRY